MPAAFPFGRADSPSPGAPAPASPVRYSIDPRACLVTFAGGAAFSPDGYRAALDAVLTDTAFEPGFDFLDDRRAAGPAPTTAEVERVVREIAVRRDLLGPGRWAVVVSHLLCFGIARMQALLLDGGDVTLRAFRDLDRARLWLAGAAEEGQQGWPALSEDGALTDARLR